MYSRTFGFRSASFTQQLEAEYSSLHAGIKSRCDTSRPPATHVIVLLFVRAQEAAPDNSYTLDSDSKLYPPQPNAWHSLDRWSRNGPVVRKHAVATEVLDKKSGGREKMLICGGENSDLDNRTWIYDPKSNSWEAVRERYGPQDKVHHTLVTLCQTRVLLFGGSTSQARSRKITCSNETWMFDMSQKKWRLLTAVIRPQSSKEYVTPRCQHTAAVVRFENSSCSCKESMLIFGGFPQSNANKPIYDLWLLTCKDDISHVYEWVKRRPSGPKLIYPKMVSAFYNTIVYLYGRSRSPSHEKYKHWVWSYHVSTGNWTNCGNITKNDSISEQLATYITDNQNHFLVLCCKNPLAMFDMIKKEWLDSPKQTEAVSFEPKDAAAFTPAKVGESILVYSRDSLYAGTSHTTMAVVSTNGTTIESS